MRRRRKRVIYLGIRPNTTDAVMFWERRNHTDKTFIRLSTGYPRWAPPRRVANPPWLHSNRTLNLRLA